MTRTRIFIADSHADLEVQLNDWFEQHPCTNVRFLQLAANGEANYAVLVAWDEA